MTRSIRIKGNAPFPDVFDETLAAVIEAGRHDLLAFMVDGLIAIFRRSVYLTWFDPPAPPSKTGEEGHAR